MIIAIIAAACAAVLIYRLGLCDGQRVASGERIKGTIVAKRRENAHEERLKRGIKNIMDYGTEGR